MTTSKALVVLGRDGMGPEADESDFLAYVRYVSDRIDEACGFAVDVETRGPRDVQENAVRGLCDDDVEHTVRVALERLWESFCADASAWPAEAI